MKEKRLFINIAVVLLIISIAIILFIPGFMKIMLLIALYACILLLVQSYRKTVQNILNQLIDYDEHQQFQAELDYVEAVNQKGYQGFVYDSYALYAHYMLGNFNDYETLAQKMSTYREWQRPKHQKFKEQVEDNLACIDFLKQYATKGTASFKGRNVILIQAIAYYQNGQIDELKDLASEQDLPKLKKACLYALLKDFDTLENLYESKQAKLLFNQIKGRELNG